MSRFSRSAGIHLAILSAFLLDFGVVLLAIYVRTHNIVLSSETLHGIHVQTLLPAIASVIAGMVAVVNTYAFSRLVVSYARWKSVGQGLSLRQISHLHSLANGGVPFTLASTALCAIAIHGSIVLLAPTLVSSLTPTNSQVNTTATYGLLSFGGLEDNTNITCAWPTVAPEYGYGTGCALNTKYGVVYDAGMGAITDSVPAEYTRDSVTYPSSLQGISGVISTLGSDLVSASNYSQVLSASVIINTCVPRMLVDVDCQSLSSEEPEQELNETEYSYKYSRKNQVWRSQDLSINMAKLCKAGNCTIFPPLTAPDYGSGSIFVFGDTDHDTGSTILILLFYGAYQQKANSTVMMCNVSSSETLLPITLIGGTSVELSEKGTSCASAGSASPSLIGNLTYMAQMVLQKSQGQDGQLSFVTEVQNATVSEAFGNALARMVGAGATEMYTELYDSSSARSVKQAYTLSVPQTHLGGRTQPWGWLVGPLLLMVLLIVGWAACMRAETHLRQLEDFNPLHPVCMAVIGMNSYTGASSRSMPRDIALASLKDPFYQTMAIPHKFTVDVVDEVAQLTHAKNSDGSEEESVLLSPTSEKHWSPEHLYSKPSERTTS